MSAISCFRQLTTYLKQSGINYYSVHRYQIVTSVSPKMIPLVIRVDRVNDYIHLQPVPVGKVSMAFPPVSLQHTLKKISRFEKMLSNGSNN